MFGKQYWEGPFHTIPRFHELIMNRVHRVHRTSGYYRPTSFAQYVTSHSHPILNSKFTVQRSACVSAESSSPEATCGPDQVLYAERLWATKRDQPVRLRTTAAGPAAETPVSIVTLLRQVVARSGDHTALGEHECFSN